MKQLRHLLCFKSKEFYDNTNENAACLYEVLTTFVIIVPIWKRLVTQKPKTLKSFLLHFFYIYTKTEQFPKNHKKILTISCSGPK